MKYGSVSALLACALLTLAAAPATAQNEWTFDGDRLLVTNLIGKVTVKGHDGSRIVVRATSSIPWPSPRATAIRGEEAAALISA